MKKTILFILMIQFSNLYSQPCGSRYIDSIFSSATTSTVQFDIQPDYRNNTDTLLADIYTPAGDTQINRAMIIFMHSSGYIEGTRQDGNIPLMCKRLAKKGYVVAAFDYRLGVDSTTPLQYGKAQIRASQDLKSFIRFAKQNADMVNVDTNKIFVAGSSVGALTALQAAYMREDQLPAFMDTTGVGSINGYGNVNGTTIKMAGVFSMWGVVLDTNWIQPGGIPVGCIQSVDDPCVPWMASTSTCFVPGYVLYGSYCINQRATNIGVYSTVYGFNSTLHEYGIDSLNALDTTIAQMSAFYYHIICNLTSDIPIHLNNEDKISVFPNPFTSNITLQHTTANLHFWLYSATGQMVKQGITGYEINTNDLPPALYFLKLSNNRNSTIVKLQKLSY